MRLGLLEIDHPVFLAPLAGITDYPFRQLAREHGCGLVFTDMVSAEGLLRRGKALVRLGPGEHPVSVQLFGEQAEALAEAARIAEESGADAVDLNMGCPARQVTETGAGAELMRHPDKVEKIVSQARRRIRCPLTVKIRSGWDDDRINAEEIARIAEGCGADAVTLHPRTRAQWFHGRADWTPHRPGEGRGPDPGHRQRRRDHPGPAQEDGRGDRVRRGHDREGFPRESLDLRSPGTVGPPGRSRDRSSPRGAAEGDRTPLRAAQGLL